MGRHLGRPLKAPPIHRALFLPGPPLGQVQGTPGFATGLGGRFQGGLIVTAPQFIPCPVEPLPGHGDRGRHPVAVKPLRALDRLLRGADRGADLARQANVLLRPGRRLSKIVLHLAKPAQQARPIGLAP